MTEVMCGFNGYKSRELLQRLAMTAYADFPFMRSRRITVAGIDVVAIHCVVYR
ncbi:MAG: hypothetical protein R3D29_11955 [Nitratireductor sp.]